MLPDVLAEENQLKAAGRALLTSCGLTDRDSEWWDAYQGVGEAYVAVVVRLLESHSLDEVIGGFSRWKDPDSAKRDVLNEAAGLIVHTSGPLPGEEAKQLADQAVQTLLDWLALHVDALAEATKVAGGSDQP